ncbi:MAG: hypothetical protein CSA70_09435 [Rhodobacterales bacterium]|nr:MAG: hypothetical protein CSA70_09435 [Rhodobacterales bacterium]
MALAVTGVDLEAVVFEAVLLAVLAVVFTADFAATLVVLVFFAAVVRDVVLRVVVDLGLLVAMICASLFLAFVTLSLTKINAHI